ncbi:MAG: family 10 glycosylhydrolase [Armatimonadetes bacterium]|nr:family 10 glycosylhydrolase [Armatimonadota bacterium]
MIALLAGAAMSFESPDLPDLPREFRGAWVATVANIDWPSRPGLGADAQKSELDALLHELAGLKFNAVVLQVRTSGDALYRSGREPSSWFLTGSQGDDIGWDPLARAVQVGHRLGLEVHAWFNPFRAGHPSQKGGYCEDHMSVARPDWVKRYGKYLWCDPGIPEVRTHALAVMTDVVQRYDIDGVHIDDYFYPYPEGGAAFPDGASYAAYVQGGGTLRKSDWRRENVDGFVETLYRSVKSVKPWVKVGISPFGIYRPNVPVGIEAGVDQYEELAADARKWLREGWCDYMAPQLYWRTDSTKQNFGRLLSWWRSENVKGRHLWPGLYTSLVGPETKKWSPDEVVRQLGLIRKGAQGSDPGEIHFSASSLKVSKLAEDLKKGPYASTAAVPETSWVKGQVPVRPRASAERHRVTWDVPEGTRFFEVWKRTDGAWTLVRIGSGPSEVWPAGCDALAVRAVSREGRTGPSTVVVRPKAG